MKTTISENTILKSSIVFLTFTAFIMSVLLFTSCSESSEVLTEDSDAALIEQIESAARESISVEVLPAATKTAFENDLADSFATSAQFASNLGYKVTIATDNAAREEAESEVFFTTAGRQLVDTSEKRKKCRNKCFEFVFPITFIMPDDTSVTLESEEDWTLIKAWYEVNPDATDRPDLVFPVEVTIEDGTVQTLVDIDELIVLKDSCRKGKNKRKCFRLVLPVSFTMPDASIITVAEKEDFKLLKEWRIANPDVEEKPALNYPVTIIYKDDTTATINDETEMDVAKEACSN